MLIRLLWYAFSLLMAIAFIALVWDYSKIFLSQWWFSKGLPHSHLSESSENYPTDNSR